MMKNNNIAWIVWSVVLVMLVSCKTDPQKSSSSTPPAASQPIKIPAFNKDSAYVFIEQQLDFGIRVPGTASHKACKDWFVEKFESYGATVIEQDFNASIFNGENWPATNIIAQFNPEHKQRVILSAHWDSRFIAEMDPDTDKKKMPIPGADDGGSGTAVLMEIARIIQNNPIDLGVDIILWDAEDQGDPSGAVKNSWCLGSQYWSRKKHKKNYRAKWGINLDMIGAKNPRFGKDEFSRHYAGQLMEKVWSLAQNMGYSDMFVNENTKGLTDDHVYVNQIGQVPMIDIINQPRESKTGFMGCWHTHCDDISIIDKRSLRVVGQVVTAVIYKESVGQL